MATSTATQKIQNTFKNESAYLKELEAANAASKTKRFQGLMAVLISGVLLTGGTYLVLKEPSSWNECVQTISAQIGQKEGILNKIAKQKVALEGTYDQNKKALVNLNKFSEVATVLKKNPEQIKTFFNQNEKLYSDVSAVLKQDEKALTGLFLVADLSASVAKVKTEAGEKELKTAKKAYLSSDAMELFTTYKSTEPNRVAPMTVLNGAIVAKGKELETAYNEISAQVNKGLTEKVDFSLGEKAFLDSANDEIKTQRSQIEAAKKSGDLDEADYSELMKDSDEAYKEISTSVSADKQKVEELVKKYGASNVQTTQNPNGGQTIIVQEKSHGMGFAEMWLLSQWMSSSSPSSYNSGYSAGVAAANNTQRSGSYASAGSTGGAVYGALNKPGTPTAAAPSNFNTQKSYSSLYSVNNPSSKVSQKFAALESSRSAGRPNFNTLSQKIAEKRNATIVRKAEAARASARAAAARTNASKTSSSSFGRTGSSMSSGGG